MRVEMDVFLILVRYMSDVVKKVMETSEFVTSPI